MTSVTVYACRMCGLAQRVVGADAPLDCLCEVCARAADDMIRKVELVSTTPEDDSEEQ